VRAQRFDAPGLVAVAHAVIAIQPPVTPELARTAWTVIAHSQFDLENFAAAEQAYYQLRTVTPADDSSAHDEIDERIASSIYKQGELARGQVRMFVGDRALHDAVPEREQTIWRQGRRGLRRMRLGRARRFLVFVSFRQVACPVRRNLFRLRNGA